MLKSRAGCFEIPCSSEDPRAFHVVKILTGGKGIMLTNEEKAAAMRGTHLDEENGR
jgi:hypothetical protein